MRKFLPLIIIAVLALGIYGWVKGFFNTANNLDEDVKLAWTNVETAYQRRNDLIGNLVNTVKGAADFEKSTLEAVINARANATKTTIDPTNTTPEQLAAFTQAQSCLSSPLSRLLVTVEKYPDLKDNQNFLKLQDELVSTENQIATQRDRFNTTIKPYNTHIRNFPGNILAGFFNLQQKEGFKAVEGAEKAPEVKFDFK